MLEPPSGMHLVCSLDARCLMRTIGFAYSTDAHLPLFLARLSSHRAHQAKGCVRLKVR